MLCKSTNKKHPFSQKPKQVPHQIKVTAAVHQMSQTFKMLIQILNLFILQIRRQFQTVVQIWILDPLHLIFNKFKQQQVRLQLLVYTYQCHYRQLTLLGLICLQRRQLVSWSFFDIFCREFWCLMLCNVFCLAPKIKYLILNWRPKIKILWKSL